MKVLYVAPDFPNTNTNAAQVRANQLLPRLAQQVDLHVLGFCKSRIKEYENTQINIETISPVNIDFLSVISRKPRAFSRYKFQESVKLLHSMINDIQPDVIHFDSIATFGLFESILEFNAMERPKVVLHSHDSVTRLYTNQYNDEKRLLRRLDLRLQLQKIKNVEKNLYPQADLCLVDSNEDAVFLKELSSDTAVNVLSLGFDGDEYSTRGHKVDLAHPSLVFSGAMGSAQSVAAVEFLYREVMPIIWKEIPQLELYLVGGNPAPQVIEIQKSDSRVHVTGFVDSLAEYLRGADVYICPLKLGSGMRTRVIEALACGCAMVASPEGVVGLKEPIDGEAWLLAKDACNFADHVIKLLANEDMRQNLGQQAALFAVAHYSWSRVTDDLINKYEFLLQGEE